MFCYAAMKPGERYDWGRFWTCNVSVPADAVREAGGFDEDFRHYGAEDTELGIRLARLGLPVLYEPRARALHDHVLTLDDLERRSRSVARAWVRLFAKHPDALRHPHWRWAATLDLDACERYALERLPRLPAWRAAARQLAGIDVAAIERASGRAAVQALLRTLEKPLRELHEVARREGFAEGLREHGVASFAELVRGPGSDRDARCTLLVWPRYGADGEIERLLEDWGPRLAGRDGLRLCVVHDAASDGDVEDAVRALEAAYARHVPDAAPLDVELIGPPKDAVALAALRDALDAVIELPGSRDAERGALLAALGLPRLADPGAALPV